MFRLNLVTRALPMPRKLWTLFRWSILICLALFVGGLLFNSSSPRHASLLEVGDALEERVEKPPVTRPVVRKTALTWTEDGSSFLLDGRPIVLLSGELHYFRVVPEYWEDRLRRLKAAGLNTVSTYVAWNLHEQQPGEYRFSEGRADLGRFLQVAKRVGLYVLLRPGPYICAEWEYGGLPAWLLRDPGMQLRTSYVPFMQAVERYFRAVYAVAAPFQYGEGGPIIGVQLENEYGTVGNDRTYLEHLRHVTLDSGIYERLFKCDDHFAIDKPDLVQMNGTLQTINADSRISWHIDMLKRIQPHAPVFVTELWTGWFTLMGGSFSTKPSYKVIQPTRDLLERGASVNFYMIHGGTNFGFFNGAVNSGGYRAMATSYDYDSPISESGVLTEKFFAIRKLLKEHSPKGASFDEPPAPIPTKAYGFVQLTEYLSLSNLAELSQEVVEPLPITFENMPINNGGGQLQGYLLYRHENLMKEGRSGGMLVINGISDFASVLVNNRFTTTGSQMMTSGVVYEQVILSKDKNTLDILVENTGRINYLPQQEKKGILGDVRFNRRIVRNWKMYPFEFDNEFVRKVERSGAWRKTGDKSFSHEGPALLRGVLNVEGTPADTFVRCDGFGKGIVVVNGNVLGRYWQIGPQRTLYLPAPWLRTGTNDILVFEMFSTPSRLGVSFSDREELGR